MAWAAPMTAAANTIFTAPEFNKYVRNNLRETAPSLAESGGQYFVSGAPNAIVARSVASHSISTSQTTTSTSYTDLATVGPTVTVTTGSMAIVWWGAQLQNSLANGFTGITVKVTGASNLSADLPVPLSYDGRTANDPERFFCHRHFPNLTPGENTFTMKYRVLSGTGTFANRHLIVMPLT